MAIIKCGKCKRTYNNDPRFFDGEVRCPFCKSKSVYNPPEENILLRQYKQEQERKKYNDFKYTCPMCSSHKIKNISTPNKVISIGIFGLASSKVGKCYECEDCKYKW